MTAYQFVAIVVAASAAMMAIMAGAFLVWRATRNSGWVDTVWSFGLGTVGAAGALTPGLLHGSVTARQALVAALVAIWAARLGLHIAWRTAGIADDPRYGRLIRDWGAAAPRRMFWLLQKQAWVSIPLALSMLLAAFNPAPGLRLQDFAGAVVLLIGIAGEALADAELRGFRSRAGNKNSICDAGLWRWSRHPNYFFEWLGWVAYPLLAIDAGWSASSWQLYPWGFVALCGPLCMYWLLVHVSGIPPLEAHMLERRGAAFRAYQARTSAFFPAPPRAL